MTTITPKAIRFGDTVLVAASAGVIDSTRLDSSLTKIKNQFDFRIPDSIFRSERYLAGTDEERADELNQGFRDPDVRAIWIARGGYGLSRILPMLDHAALLADPIPIIGYSDVTALHSWALKYGVRGIHAPVFQFLDSVHPEDLDWLIKVLTGKDDGVLATDAYMGESPLEGAAELVGGNLSILAHLIGTPFQLDAKNRYLLMEDVGEKPYVIDRYLTQLGQAGMFNHCRGVLVGDFTKCDDVSHQVLDTLHERLNAFVMPSLCGLPVGHGERNRAFSFGGRVLIEGSSVHLVDRAVS